MNVLLVAFFTLYNRMGHVQKSFVHCKFAPVYVWPLGEGTGTKETLTTNSTDGVLSNVVFNTGPAHLAYRAIQFPSGNNSYVDFPVQYHRAFDEEFSTCIYIFLTGDGVIFHFKSDDFDSRDNSYLKSVKVARYGDDFVTSVSNGLRFTQQTTTIVLNTHIWYDFCFVRSPIINAVDFILDEVVYSPLNPMESWINGMLFSFPGVMRIGGSQDEPDHFSGRLTCLTMGPFKSYLVHGQQCLQLNNTIGSTLTSASIAPTCVSPTTNAYTTATESDSTSLKVTFNTTFSPPTTSTARGSTTTFPSTLTTATGPSTSPLSTSPATSVAQLLRVTSDTFAVPSICKHSKIYQRNAIYKNVSDILQIYHPSNIAACTGHCNSHAACGSFAFKANYCWIGKTGPKTRFQEESVMFTLI